LKYKQSQRAGSTAPRTQGRGATNTGSGDEGLLPPIGGAK